MSRTVTFRVSTDRNGVFDDFKHDLSYEHRMQRARKFVHELDTIDGFSQADLPIDVCLRTVMSALAAGIKGARWDTVEEAYVMLQQLECKTRELAHG